MQPKDKNFWLYVLKHLAWLVDNNQVWKIFVPLYLIAVLVWFNSYHEELLVNTLIKNNQQLMAQIDSMQNVFKAQKANFELILRDVMGDYGDLIPKQAVFLGQAVPVNHLSARQTFNRMFRYLFKYKIEVRDALERFHFYEPAIIDSLKKYQLPLDLRFIFLAESWAYPLAVSSVGATGGWQFMRYTAAEWKVEINNEIDMRLDPWYMSQVVCKYISYLRQHSHSNQEAVRAYNTGLRRFLQVAAKQSWVTKTWFIDTNDENNIYLSWILAWKWIYKQPLKFGIKINYDLPPLKIKTIKVKIDAWRYKNNLTFLKLARATQCDMFLLKDLNPAFLKIDRQGAKVIPASPYQRYAVRYLKLPVWVKIKKLDQLKVRGVKFLFN